MYRLAVNGTMEKSRPLLQITVTVALPLTPPPVATTFAVVFTAGAV
jgi:hypothetical protein